MNKSKGLKHVTRIEQEKKRHFGWWVRIMRDGVMYQKFFSDYAHGGKGGAMLRAIAYRDELLEQYPKPEHGNMFNRPNARNRSGGFPGVHKTTQQKRGATYGVWVAGWTLPDGSRVTRKFHFSESGRSEKEARQLAIKARAEGLAAIERMRRAPQKRRRNASSKKAASKPAAKQGTPRKPVVKKAAKAQH